MYLSAVDSLHTAGDMLEEGEDHNSLLNSSSPKKQRMETIVSYDPSVSKCTGSTFLRILTSSIIGGLVARLIEVAGARRVEETLRMAGK